MVNRALCGFVGLCLLHMLGACQSGLNAASDKAAADSIASDNLGPPPETFVLDNGLEVIVIPDHRAPVVTHMVWYRVGAADEPKGKSGIAHFLEHLMFKGTDKIPTAAFSKIVARNGGQDNAFTSEEYTAYFQHVALDKLPLVMGMEADRMANLKLTKEVVLPERDVVLEERRSRIENDPLSRLAEQMDAALFKDHPYGIPIIGWPQEVSKLTLEDAIGFYNRFYTPDNALLIVAGDITAAQLRPLAEQTYGQVGKRAVVGPRERPRKAPLTEPVRLQLVDDDTRQPVWRRLYLAPSYAKPEGLVAESFEVLADILGGGSTSRLYRKLVVEQKLAAQASAWYSGAALGQGSFGISLVPRPGVTPEKLEKAFDVVLAEFLAQGALPEEVERSKRNILTQAVYARDSQRNMAQIYGVSLTSGETVEDVLSWPKKMRALTPQDVTAAARAVLGVPGFVSGVLLPTAMHAAMPPEARDDSAPEVVQ